MTRSKRGSAVKREGEAGEEAKEEAGEQTASVFLKTLKKKWSSTFATFVDAHVHFAPFILSFFSLRSLSSTAAPSTAALSAPPTLEARSLWSLEPFCCYGVRGEDARRGALFASPSILHGRRRERRRDAAPTCGNPFFPWAVFQALFEKLSP